jgi:hypothetical protein
MKRNKHLFVDEVNNKPVYEWRDCYSQLFMAQSKLGFRVKKSNAPADGER